jgi:hypothetical protein
MYLAAITPDLRLAKSSKLDKNNKFLIRSDATDLVYLVDFKDCILIRSNYRNPLTAVFKRQLERKNKATSQAIELDDLPQRFTGDAALKLIDECSRWRGEDKKPRKMHPNSLRNLKPLKKGCKALPRVYSAPLELTERAAQLRACGHTFKAIGDSLDLTESQVKYLLQGSPSNPYVRGYEAPITQVLLETFKTADLAGEKQENHLNDAISNKEVKS